MLAPDPHNCLHNQHPDLATWKTRSLPKPSEWWFPFGRRSPRYPGPFCTPIHIHDLLQREGFGGSYDAVRRYAARWKRERRADAGDMGTVFIPLMYT
ncbi:hypothetical protein [Novosphingobium sp. AAP1]|uniref:hypothetical protein n=1 Tax=Novosphingobium sp. AAP1 TaxID=1523413 RepID=UPI0009E74FB0|nr:hypothetical protein [Novosphingobium sp. AAP1]